MFSFSDNNKYKITILGDKGTGKNSLLIYIIYNCFTDKSPTNLGIAYFQYTLKYSNHETLQYFLVGTYNSSNMVITDMSLYDNASCFLIVYDVTSRDSFEHIKTYLTTVEKYTKSPLIAIIGTKVDLKDERKVSFNEGYDFAKTHNFLFIEVSSKLGYNVKELLFIISKKIIAKKNKERIKEII